MLVRHRVLMLFIGIVWKSGCETGMSLVRCAALIFFAAANLRGDNNRRKQWLLQTSRRPCSSAVASGVVEAFVATLACLRWAVLRRISGGAQALGEFSKFH
mmetsp:Transcript_266/g.596  ORF Transcript_266/g.596 Transcript_266/m.596 type:complete len:101 (-) Transcript_266:9-311(-)